MRRVSKIYPSMNRRNALHCVCPLTSNPGTTTLFSKITFVLHCADVLHLRGWFTGKMFSIRIEASRHRYCSTRTKLPVTFVFITGAFKGAFKQRFGLTE